MRELLERNGLFVHQNATIAFEPFKKLCSRKRKDFQNDVGEWMYMYHDWRGIHYYKHAISRRYIAINRKGRIISDAKLWMLALLDRWSARA